MRKKPQGWNSVIDLGSTKPFSSIILPDGKSEREAVVVDRFCKSLGASDDSNLRVREATQNREDDFDFKLETTEGEKILELTEFAPLSGRGGFANAPDRLNVGAAADALINAIMKKADHYAHKPTGLILLVYVTHYAFQPIEDVFLLVEDRLRRLRPFFECVFFIIPNSNTASEIRILYPAASPCLSPDATKKLRGRWFANSNFSREADDN